MDGTAEMIFSGDELLRGDTLNTNQAYLGERLLDLGFFVTHALCVADDLAALTTAITDSLSRRPALLVLSGGSAPQRTTSPERPWLPPSTCPSRCMTTYSSRSGPVSPLAEQP